MSRSLQNVTMLAPLLLAGTLLACGGENPASNSNYPPPGEMRTVSVQPLETPQVAAAARENLIANGDFSDWWPGAPVPNGFQGPVGDASEVQAQNVAGIKAINQRWTKTDVHLSPNERFHTVIPGLKPNTPYTLEVRGIYLGGRPVELELFAPGAGGAWDPLENGVIRLIPTSTGIYKAYLKRFQLQSGQRLLLASRASGSAEAHWLGFRLYED